MGETEVERLIIRIIGDTSMFKRSMQEVEQVTHRVTARLNSTGDPLKMLNYQMRGYAGSFTGLLAPIAGAAGFAGITAGIYKAVQGAAQLETLTTSFEVLTGSAMTAQKTIADLKKFAADTPFEFPELAEAAKQMIAFGEAPENIVGTMRKLGDIASGLNIPIGSLTYLFGTLKSQGRAFTVDINQFAMRGIPIWEQLEKQFGKTNGEVRKLVEEGKVGFADVEKAFESLTNGTGVRNFGGMMERQSKSLAGIWSNLKDNLGQTLEKIGTMLVERLRLKDVLQAVTDTIGAVSKALEGSQFRAAADLIAAGFKYVKETVVDAFTAAVEWVKKFYQENQILIRWIVAGYAAYFAAAAAVKILVFALTTAWGLMVALKLNLVLGAALWLVYKAAVLAVSATTLTYAVSLGILKAVMWLTTASTWSLSAALTFLTGVMSVSNVVTVIAFSVTLGLVSAAMIVVAAAAYGAWKALESFFLIISNVDTGSGVLGKVGDTLGEWGRLLREVVTVARTDLPMAWELMAAGAGLAISQIRDMWPSVWAYVRGGWEIVWDAVKLSFVSSFYEALGLIAIELQRTNYLISDEAAAEASARIKDVSEKARKAIRDLAGTKLDGLGKALGDDIKESDATKEARKKVDEIRKEIEERAAHVSIWQRLFPEGFGDAVAKMGKKVVDTNNEIKKSVKDADDALFGSAEARRRIAAYKEMLNTAGKAANATTPPGGAAGGGIGPAANAMNPAVPPPNWAIGPKEVVSELAEIRKLLEEEARNSITIPKADLVDY